MKRKSFQRMRCQDSELGSQRAVKRKTFHKTEMSGGEMSRKLTQTRALEMRWSRWVPIGSPFSTKGFMSATRLVWALLVLVENSIEGGAAWAKRQPKCSSMFSARPARAQRTCKGPGWALTTHSPNAPEGTCPWRAA